MTQRNSIPLEQQAATGDGDDLTNLTEDGVVSMDLEAEIDNGRDTVPRYPSIEMSCNSKIRYGVFELAVMATEESSCKKIAASRTVRVSSRTSRQPTMKAVSVSGMHHVA